MKSLLFISLLAFAAATSDNAAVQLLGIDGGTPNILYNFLASNPALVRRAETLTGLQNGESLLSIARYSSDFYGVSNMNRIYHINATTSAASFISTLICNVQHSNPALSLAFDAAGTLHIVSLIAENTTNHWEAQLDGSCTAKPILTYGSDAQLGFPSLTGIAYNGDQSYLLDANANSVLSTLNGEALSTIGSLNHMFSGVGGFAVATNGGSYFGLAALYTPYNSSLWAINLKSGASYEAATLGNLVTNLLGFAVLADGLNVDYPFPYLGTVYDPNAQYTYATSNGEEVYGNGNGATASGNGNTASGNGNENPASGNGNGVTSSGNGNGDAPVPSGSGNGNNGNNGNGNGNGYQTQVVVSNTAITATLNTPSASGTDSFTTTATTQGTDGVTATDVATVFPVGSNGRQQITYTESIAAYDYRGVSQSRVAGVQIPTSGVPVAAFTETVLLGQGTATSTAFAGVAIPAGQSATQAVVEGTSTQEAVVLLNGAKAVTIGQLENVGSSAGTATARVTIADAQGRTHTGIATFAIVEGTDTTPLATFNRGQSGAASAVSVSFGLAVVAIVAAMF